MKLGQIIKEYRESQALSQRAFALKCGVTNSVISMLENDLNNHTGKVISPNLDTLNKIADAIGITTTELLRRMDDTQVTIPETMYLRPGIKALFNAAQDASDEDIQ